MFRFLVLLFLCISFISCSGYIKENGQVFYEYVGHDYKKHREVLNDVDFETFEDINDELGKDKTALYYRSKRFTNIDVNTFELLSDTYGKDKNSVYFISSESIKCVEGADSETFEVLDYYYGKDKAKVFNREQFYFQPSDIGTLEIVKNTDEHLFKDSRNYYHNDTIADVDYDSFKLLSRSYAMDKNRVYYLYSYDFSVMPEADVESFEVLTRKVYIGGVSKDKNHYYVGKEIVSREKASDMPDENFLFWFLDKIF